jgi:hypothetical protein
MDCLMSDEYSYFETLNPMCFETRSQEVIKFYWGLRTEP